MEVANWNLMIKGQREEENKLNRTFSRKCWITYIHEILVLNVGPFDIHTEYIPLLFQQFRTELHYES